MSQLLRYSFENIKLLRWAALALASALLFAVAAPVSAAGPGFRSRQQFEEHYAKHGAEFGNISRMEYLRRAQELRDAPVGRDILREARGNGVVTKFDRRHGYFGAYNLDGTIRTFFIPNDGERYFRRQARRR
jgi:pyocin large subunit-like protein